MFSLFSRQKPDVFVSNIVTAAASDSNLKEKSETNSSIPVVDFNTINNDAIVESKQIYNKSKSGFRLWPFGGKELNIQDKQESTVSNKSTLTDVNNKVIAMKRLNNNDLSDDFIDIQITKLSYAEVASLTKNGIINNKPQTTLVINKEKELEKSISDLELAEAYIKNKEASKNSRSIDRLNYEEICDNQLIEDDEIDEFSFDAKKPSRKFKNKRSKKLYNKK